MSVQKIKQNSSLKKSSKRRQVRGKRTEKDGTNSTLVDSNPAILMITLNVNGLKIQIKRYRLTD